MSDDPKCPECGGFRGLPRMLHDEEVPRECAHEFHRLPDVIKFPNPPEQAANVTAQQESNVGPKTFVPNPICPYCGADPCNLKARTLKMGPFDLMLVRCANDDCRKTLGIFPVGFNGPQMAPVGLVQ